ncbi:MAG: lysoplasmalogenase [Clostridia bacterium]|nr:lysoplasmalogenase [Clostridia bacterium]
MNHYFRWFGLPGSFVLTMLMFALALVLALCFHTKDRWWCLAAMLLSSLGDIVLMNFRGVGDKMPIPYFYVGAFFFIFAHLLYTGGYLTLIREHRFKYINPGFWTAVGVILAAGLLLTFLSLRDKNASAAMYVLCLTYMCIIGTACATIFSYAWSIRSWRSIAALGALSFFISDYIIGIGKLMGYSTPALQEAIWWFYPIGQIIIIICG